MPLDTKVRWKGGTLLILTFALLFRDVVGSGPKCNKIPPTQVKDQIVSMLKFKIKIPPGSFSNQG